MSISGRFYAFALMGLCAIAPALKAQEPIKKRAFSGVHVHHADGKLQKNVNLLWTEKFITEVGKASVEGYLSIDGGDSLHVYPAFIDGYGTHGSADADRGGSVDDPGNPPLDRAGIQPHRKPHLMWDEKKYKEFEQALKMGFGAANLALKGYMLPGATDIAVMTDGTPLVILPESGQAAAFANAPGGWRNGVYPSTLMGVMARFRQLWYDAEALKSHIELYEAGKVAEPPVRSQEHEALFDYLNGQKPLYFVADAAEDIERILKLQDELGFSFVLVSGKEAYKKVDELKARKIAVLATFSFDGEEEKESKKGDKDKKEAEEELSEDEKAFKERAMKARAEQIQNIKTLMKSGVKVGYASMGEGKGDFKKGMKALMSADYSENELLQVLTVNTAEILGVGAQLGHLKKQYMANFIVTDKPLSDEKAKILYTVSGGVLKDHTRD